LRVISGTLKGKKLLSAKGLSLRPTSDRVRESVFDILQGNVEGLRVLDLFAGTGAMGIEALSRGAISAVFIENQKSSLEILRKNLSACRMEAVTQVLAKEAEEGLRLLEGQGGRFELIFLDPPYGQGLVRRLWVPETLIVAEHSPAEEVEGGFPWERVDFRKYGGTRISFFRKAG
jgi:16S rRNA (guanine(966)-N(2))-methyltransferase RsmD